MTRLDAHVKVLDDAVVARAKRRSLDALVYAPHFTALPTIRERAARYTDDDLLVVPGRELFAGHWTDRTHVLAVDPAEPIPDFITLEATMTELARQEATVVAPHPEFLSVSLDAADLRAYRETIDALEVYNPKLGRRHADRAKTLAGIFDYPGVGSSYAHLRGTVGEVWTELDRTVDSPGEVASALADGEIRRVVRRNGRGHRLRRLAEQAHLSYENSVEKVDRVLLSGREATHPDEPLYDGRFDHAIVSPPGLDR